MNLNSFMDSYLQQNMQKAYIHRVIALSMAIRGSQILALNNLFLTIRTH